MQGEQTFKARRMLGPEHWQAPRRSSKKRREAAATDTSLPAVRTAICPGLAAGMPDAADVPSTAEAGDTHMRIPVSASCLLTYPSSRHVSAPVAYGAYIVHAALFGVPSQQGMRDYWCHAYSFQQRALRGLLPPDAASRPARTASVAPAPLEAEQRARDAQIVFSGADAPALSHPTSIDSTSSATSRSFSAPAASISVGHGDSSGPVAASAARAGQAARAAETWAGAPAGARAPRAIPLASLPPTAVHIAAGTAEATCPSSPAAPSAWAAARQFVQDESHACSRPLSPLSPVAGGWSQPGHCVFTNALFSCNAPADSPRWRHPPSSASCDTSPVVFNKGAGSVRSPPGDHPRLDSPLPTRVSVYAALVQ